MLTRCDEETKQGGIERKKGGNKGEREKKIKRHRERKYSTQEKNFHDLSTSLISMNHKSHDYCLETSRARQKNQKT